MNTLFIYITLSYLLFSASARCESENVRGCKSGKIEPILCYAKADVAIKNGEASEAKQLFRVVCDLCSAPTINPSGPNMNFCEITDACTNSVVFEIKDENFAEVKKIAAKKCSPKKPNMCVALGIAEKQLGHKEAAKNALKIACDADVPVGCAHYGGLETDKAKAEPALIKSCKAGVTTGCEYLQFAALTTKDIPAQRRLAKIACDGWAVACGVLGSIEAGMGNFSESRGLFTLACDAGNNEACLQLQRMTKEGH